MKQARMSFGRTLLGRRNSLLATVAAGAGLLAIGAASTGQPAPAAAPSQSAAQLATVCTPETLAGIASSLGSGVTVRKIGNAPPTMPSAVRFSAKGAKLNAFCQVTGSFVTNPATGKTANFLATFPENWNGKYLQVGCSGHCGQFAVGDVSSPTIAVTYPGSPFDIINRGYASFATDEGHEGFAGGTWAVKGPGQVDEDAIDDFYYRADKVLARMGKRFTTAFYGRVNGRAEAISRSYFNGCSGGGRDAFVAASYFPEEFDGIIGGSAYNAAGAAFQHSGVPVATIRSAGAAIPPALFALIDPIVKGQCDDLDGVKDGLIQNPAACNFRPERDLPICTRGGLAGQCFTPTQIETLSTLITAVTDEKGNVVQPGLTVSEINPLSFITPKQPADLSAIDPFPNSDNGDSRGNGYWPLADAFIKVFVHGNDPNFFTRSILSYKRGGPGSITDYRIVVPSSEVSLLQRRARMGTGHFPENLAGFLKQDRKFLIWHNLSDNVLTPYMSINYYNRAATMYGGYDKLQRNVRLFTLPGTPHCNSGGVGPNTFDALTAIENWVERGVAPDALMASQQPVIQPYNFKDFSKPPIRTMPLCAFPAMARYTATGDVKDGSNWSCPAGDRSMLRLGESGRRAGVLR
jgi:feruloyl esterase